MTVPTTSIPERVNIPIPAIPATPIGTFTKTAFCALETITSLYKSTANSLNSDSPTVTIPSPSGTVLCSDLSIWVRVGGELTHLLINGRLRDVRVW
ncbi:hypothetical protein HanIR_Chr14g0684801 [Helianthus annuus]|nr:hypothetical protein HanIR_Chr14g0684801 [Helianthus annuus]